MDAPVYSTKCQKRREIFVSNKKEVNTLVAALKKRADVKAKVIISAGLIRHWLSSRRPIDFRNSSYKQNRKVIFVSITSLELKEVIKTVIRFNTSRLSDPFYLSSCKGNTFAHRNLKNLI